MVRFPCLALALLLLLAACGGGGGGTPQGPAVPPAGGGDPLEEPPAGAPDEAPAITLTAPAHAEEDVARDGFIRVHFAAVLDAQSVVSDSLVLEGHNGPIAGRTIRVAPNVIEFLPDEDLPYGDVLVATLQPGIADRDGNVRQGSYAFAFRVREASPRLALLHESESTDVRGVSLAMNDSGDGLSVMFESDAAQRGLRFRRVRGGVPTGIVEPIVAQTPGASLPRRTLDVAENGNAQFAWIHQVSGRPSAFVRQFDRGTDSWGPLLQLTNDPTVQAVSVDAEFNDLGGYVAWIERDVTDLDNQRVFAGRYDDGLGLRQVRSLGAATGSKASLRMSHAGAHGVLAFGAEVTDSFQPFAARFSQAQGFHDPEPLDAGFAGAVRAAVASPTGHLYVLLARLDPTDDSRALWHLAIAGPGQPFAAPIPLHGEFAPLGRGRLSTGENGVLTLVYSVAGGERGTFARRFVPGQGLSAPIEITGLDRPVSGILTTDALNVRSNARGDAVASAAIALPAGGQAIRAALLPHGEAWTVGIEIAEDADERPTARIAHVAIEPSGGALVMWTSIQASLPDPLHYVLRLRRVRENGTLQPVHTYNAATPEVLTSPFLELTPEGRGVVLYTRLGGNAGGPDDVLHALVE